MLEAVEGVLAGGDGSDAPCAILSAGGRERRTLCVGAAGGCVLLAGGHALCAALYAGAVEGELCLLEVLEVMSCMRTYHLSFVAQERA